MERCFQNYFYWEKLHQNTHCCRDQIVRHLDRLLLVQSMVDNVDEVRVRGSALTDNVMYKNALAVWSPMFAELIIKTKTCLGRFIPVDIRQVPDLCRVALLISIFSRKYDHFLVSRCSLLYSFCPSEMNNNRDTINCNFVMITPQSSAACQIKLPSDSRTRLISIF